MASNARIRYLITTLGSVITMISGILVLLLLFISGLAGAAQLMFFNPAGFVVIGSSIVMAIFPVIWIILAYIISCLFTSRNHGISCYTDNNSIPMAFRIPATVSGEIPWEIPERII